MRINDALMTWNAMSAPANLRDLWASWEKVRATLSVLAFVLQV